MKKLYLIRHGETLWSKSGQHTSYTDLELTPHGINQVLAMRAHLPLFDQVLISPLKRAAKTAELLGLTGSTVKELIEWNYWIYEGKTSKEIKSQCPEWNIFTHGALFGETTEEVINRAKKILNVVDSYEGTTCLISSGHFIRVLIATYLHQPCSFGKNVLISTASITILSEEKGNKVIETLNQQF